MKLFNTLIILFSISLSSYAQVRVIDPIINNIGSIYENTKTAIRIDEIEDEMIKITFNADTTSNTDYFGEIYLNSYEDLEDLFQIINDGLQQKKDHITYVDINQQMKLTLRFAYNKSIFGSYSDVQIMYYYYDEPYERFRTKKISDKDIKILFNKNIK